MTTQHLSDAILLATIDQDLGDPLELKSADHLASCSVCQARLEDLQGQSDRLDRVFAIDEAVPIRTPRVASPKPSRGARRRYLLAAGIVVFVAAAGLSPLRAFVTEWMTGQPAQPQPSVTAPPDSHQFDFDVVGDTFELRIEGRQARGTVVIQLQRTERGSIRVSGGDGTETIALEIAGATVHMGAGAQTQLDVRLPAELPHITVFAMGRRVAPDWVPDDTSSSRTWTLRLGER